MKKILLFASIIALSVACSSNDDSQDNTPNNPSDNYVYSTKITPPTWIQGKWGMVHPTQPDHVITTQGFTFTVDDFCHFEPTSNYCWKNAIENPTDNKFVQEISTNRYRMFRVNQFGGIVSDGINREFLKKSDTEIILTLDGVTDTYRRID